MDHQQPARAGPPAPKLTPTEAGRRGGLATLERWGTEHMREIGVLGYLSTLERHWQGDGAAHQAYLVRLSRARPEPCPRNRCRVRRVPPDASVARLALFRPTRAP